MLEYIFVGFQLIKTNNARMTIVKSIKNEFIVNKLNNSLKIKVLASVLFLIIL